MMYKEYKATLSKVLLHLKNIFIHKWWVFYYCCKVGLVWRGITHDLSKFSPAEFIPNIKYVKPGISPIDVQKQEIGYAPAWIHHKGHNSHHYEYWMDKFDDGTYSTRMPLDDAIELICDMIAANKVYNGKNATPETLLDYWNKQKNKSTMHPDTKKFVDTIFCRFYNIWDFEENDSIDNILNYRIFKFIYDNIINKSKYPLQVKIQDIIKENKK